MGYRARHLESFLDDTLGDLRRLFGHLLFKQARPRVRWTLYEILLNESPTRIQLFRSRDKKKDDEAPPTCPCCDGNEPDSWEHLLGECPGICSIASRVNLEIGDEGHMRRRQKWVLLSRRYIIFRDYPLVTFMCNQFQAKCLQLNRARWKKKFLEKIVSTPNLPEHKRAFILLFFQNHKAKVQKEYDEWGKVEERFQFYQRNYADNEWRRWIFNSRGVIFLDAVSRTSRSFMQQKAPEAVVFCARLQKTWDMRNLRTSLN